MICSISIFFFYVPLYIREKKREREIEEGMELVFDGTLDGTHRVKRFKMLKILMYVIFYRVKLMWCQKTCHIITDGS